MSPCLEVEDHGIGVEEVLKILKSRKDIHSLRAQKVLKEAPLELVVCRFYIQP